MKSYTKRILVLIAGWGFILLGILGLFLPILQGVLFLLVGLIILSWEYVWADRLLTRLRARFPKIGRTAGRPRRRRHGYGALRVNPKRIDARSRRC